ncbi:MAG: ABC transporter ATP-binding protein/permease [Planctomycetes bacterium]|jgi:ABC-type multidrug transport system fused ATPase/permease subunit|nr:ABC transporter ATP-binding protein/permease [Planctomycetota bacterium]
MTDINDKNTNLKSFWPKLWGLLKPAQSQIKVLLIFIVLDELAQLAGPYLLKMIIDQLTESGAADLLALAGLVGALFAVNQALIQLGYIQDKRIFRILVEIEKYLSEFALEKMVELHLDYHERNNTGAKISRIQRGIERVTQLQADFFWQVAPTLIQVVLTVAALFFVDWRFGLAFLVYAPVFGLMTLKLNRRIYPLRRARHDQYEKGGAKMAEAIININTVKSFVQEKREVADFRRITDEVKRISLQEFFFLIRYNFGRSTVINLGRITMVAFGIFLVAKGAITLGSLVFVVTLAEKALLSLFRITKLYDRIMDSSEAIERLAALGEERSAIVNPVPGLKPVAIAGQIAFKNVSFTYPSSQGAALRDADFKINAGCVTALVGPSGGGKTTIARLIFRHYDPQTGRILLDDHDLKDYDVRHLRRFMAIVPQDVEIFDTTIKANIAYASPDAGFEEIQAAAKIANADEFIVRLPKGYDSIVGERGIKLSGGQKQRVGIARAVLANPRVLIFDEATSHLDSQSEALIQASLDKIAKGRTVIIIAHRLSTVMKADKILVFDQGRLVEQGSHLELVKNSGGIYSRLSGLQNLLRN